MQLIFHVAREPDWEKAKLTRKYAPGSLQEESFIHCSTISQLSSVLETYFSDEAGNLVLLCINESRVKSSILYEGSTPVLYPHIYGPLNLSAVVEALSLKRERSGRWELPLRARQMTKYIELKTPRLIMREIAPLDFEDIHAYASLGQVVQYQLWGPNTEEDTLTFINECIESQKESPRTDYYLGLVLKDEGRLIGACNLTLDSERHRRAEFGYTIHPDYWAKGYGTEAVAGLLHLGFTHLQLHRMTATCDDRNLASARILEKNGLSQEGLLRENFWLKGKWRSSRIYGILKKEWRKQRA